MRICVVAKRRDAVFHTATSGMGHAWAGGAAGQAFCDANYDSAAELGWAFFKHYAW